MTHGKTILQTPIMSNTCFEITHVKDKLQNHAPDIKHAENTLLQTLSLSKHVANGAPDINNGEKQQ